MKASSYFTMVSYLDKVTFPFPLLSLWWGSKGGRMDIHVTTTILQFFLDFGAPALGAPL